MKKLAVVMVLLLGLILVGTACTKTVYVTPTPKEFSLSDASELLNLSPFLPMSFEHIDAHSEGLSNEDIGLGPRFSEVEVFLRDKPFQLIYTVLRITESRWERSANDAVLEDDTQVRSIIESRIQKLAREEGVDDNVAIDFQISHPHIGNLATSGQGSLQVYGAFIGFEVFFFRRNDTYVYLYSWYYSEEDIVFLESIATGLYGRLLQY